METLDITSKSSVVYNPSTVTFVNETEAYTTVDII